MLPMVAVRLQLGALLAADATTLAPASDANMIALIIAPFSLSENLVVGDLTLATANGLAPIAGATGAQEVALDPTTNQQLITLKPGASSGWRWVTSGGLSVPITVYGIALTDNAGTTLLGAGLLPAPVTVAADGYQIDVDPVQMTLVLNPIS